MDDRRLVRMFKALSHPNRFRLFTEIREQGQGEYEDSDLHDRHVCFLHDVMDALNVGAPTVSHHLKELVSAELITTERQGKFVTCRVNADALESLRAFLTRD